MEPSAEEYWLVVDGKPEGPYSIDQLKILNISPADFVRAAYMDDYKEAHEIAALRELLGFKKPAHIPQYFGSFDQRLLASALDWFLISGTFILITLIIVMILKDKPNLKAFLALPPIIAITKLIYHTIMECSVKQGTFGKQLLKIKVSDMEGNRITLAHSAGRNAAKAFSVLTLFTGYLLSFFTKKQQCLHDLIAGTLVIKDRLF